MEIRYISRQEARQINKENKQLKVALIIAVILLAVAGLIIYKQHRTISMTEYAIENDCEWYYSYYINEQPICK